MKRTLERMPAPAAHAGGSSARALTPLVCLFLTLSPGVSPPTRAEDASAGKGNVETALQGVDTSSSSAWFERYREVPDGFVLESLHYDWTRQGHDDFLEISGTNAFQLDERYGVSFGRHGVYRVNLDYDVIPHLFSRDARSLHSREGDSGVYTVADQIQADFEALDDTTSLAAGDTVGTATLARDLLSSTDTFDLGLKRQTSRAAAVYTPRLGWRFELEGSSERRTGTRALSNGSYIRTSVGSGLTHTADTFRVLPGRPSSVRRRVHGPGTGDHQVRRTGSGRPDLGSQISDPGSAFRPTPSAALPDGALEMAGSKAHEPGSRP